jgi:ribosome maturation factor RimP
VDDKLQGVVVAELDTLGFDLVEMRRGGTRSRPVLDVRIDRRDGGKVAIEDCVRASRAIEAKLDGDESLISGRYVLEVSSPGAERPLYTVADWRRFVGRRAKVLAPALGGRVEVDIVGIEEDAGAGEIAVLRDAKGLEHRIPLAEVKEARLAIKWK